MQCSTGGCVHGGVGGKQAPTHQTALEWPDWVRSLPLACLGRGWWVVGPHLVVQHDTRGPTPACPHARACQFGAIHPARCLLERMPCTARISPNNHACKACMVDVSPLWQAHQVGG